MMTEWEQDFWSAVGLLFEAVLGVALLMAAGLALVMLVVWAVLR